MQQEPPKSSTQRNQPDKSPIASPSSQHGLLHHDPNDLHRVGSDGSQSTSPRSGPLDNDSSDGFSPDKLDEKLLRLRFDDPSRASPPVPGQRVIDYENALIYPGNRHSFGFKVIKRSEPRADGVQLEDLPNDRHITEILTHILSHLHPDSHNTVALVSKRFYALVTTPHAWRMAFQRFFPGHSIIGNKASKRGDDGQDDTNSDALRSDTRYFSRLTPLATWRSEYLFRTRLLRSLERGKPGAFAAGAGSSGRSKQNIKKTTAVLTYNSKLPWVVSHLHAVFANGKKPPRAIQGTSDLGVGTVSDPTTGKIEKWGLEAPNTFPQLEEVVPNLVPYGLGDGPAGVPNVMDVSQPYGLLAGEGFPGGRAFFRGANEASGRYLDPDSGVADSFLDIPRIPEITEAISCVWLAKSSAVPTVTESMVGMFVGSTAGVVTSYSLGSDSGGLRFSMGDMTGRWALSPGVPIVSLKVDEHYSIKRKTASRVWAVALNALGEVYYLAETPKSIINRAQGDDIVRHAWLAGRTVFWHLLEETRRTARPDELDKSESDASYSPYPPSDSMKLDKDQLIAKAREAEKFMHYQPSHFLKVCQGWDMQRRLEVDFANDSGDGVGESIFVIDCGLTEGQAPCVKRHMRICPFKTGKTHLDIETQPSAPKTSLFGHVNGEQEPTPSPLDSQSPLSPPSTPQPRAISLVSEHEWNTQTLELSIQANATISTSALDSSLQSTHTLAEDALHVADHLASLRTSSDINQASVEIPGRRARFIAIGTSSGEVIVWNARDNNRISEIAPIRMIQTQSPEISSLGLSALYLVHGGSDGLVQVWDPLGSTVEAIRTINSRHNGRVPRHMMVMNPALAHENYSAAGAIFLDPDPTILRGIVSFGAFMRYWAYSSNGHFAHRKRRHRHSDIHGRIASRRQGGTSSRYIAAEEAELRIEDAERAKEKARLRNRFGVGALGDLTEEEALLYAQLISEEAFHQEEQMRASDSAADTSVDTASSFSGTTTDTATPEPSIAGPSQSGNGRINEDDEYEQQIQQAMRLSLLESGNDTADSPRGNSAGDFEFAIKYKPKNGKKSKASGSGFPSSTQSPANGFVLDGASTNQDEDADLAIALSLSMQDQTLITSSTEFEDYRESEEFPALETEGIGKGKGIQRW
ncbi:unnamed protein product [Clonostachys byssicola]|uniref:F-box domain-containing protein n=1 Tax=Clonostachys byssicola TaxID=160290 RepID=A0A9N9UVG9_9HYPO|nr:unnamed protein product [Clonostachys byssicola]